MFNNPSTYEYYQLFNGMMARKEITAFERTMRTCFSSVCQSQDELRLLFYIAVQEQDWFLRQTLRHFKAWQCPQGRKAERVQILLTAINRYCEYNKKVVASERVSLISNTLLK